MFWNKKTVAKVSKYHLSTIVKYDFTIVLYNITTHLYDKTLHIYGKSLNFAPNFKNHRQ